MGTSLTVETMLANKGLIRYLGKYFDFEEVLHRISDILHCNEKNSIH